MGIVIKVLLSSLILIQINACSRSYSDRQNEPAQLLQTSKQTNKTTPQTAVASSSSLLGTSITPEYLAGSSTMVANQILVISKKGQSFKNSDKQLKVTEQVSLNQLSIKIALLTLKHDKLDKNAIKKKMAELKKNNPSLHIQPNFIYYLNGKENSKQRAIPQYALKMTGLNKKNRSTGKGIKIALIDTPIDTKHPSLKGASIKKYNYVETKGMKHGTAIAGILVGRGRIKGVAPDAQLISIGAFNEPQNSKSLGLSTSFVLGKAFNKALEENVNIINLSFGSTEVDPLMQRLAAETLARHTVLLASVGNDNHQTSVRYPASIKGVYAITAIDAKSKIYKRANTGSPVDYALPGVGILTTKPGGKYTSVTGTSFATAYASGIFALQLEERNTINFLHISVIDLGKKGKDNFFGRGLIRY